MPPLDRLLSMFKEDVASIAREMADGTLGPRGFRVYLSEAVEEYHIAASLTAAGKARLSDLSSEALAKLERTIDFHVGKAEAFARDVEQNGWTRAHEARANLYVGGIKTSYGIGQWADIDAPPNLPQPGERAP